MLHIGIHLLDDGGALGAGLFHRLVTACLIVPPGTLVKQAAAAKILPSGLLLGVEGVGMVARPVTEQHLRQTRVMERRGQARQLIRRGAADGLHQFLVVVVEEAAAVDHVVWVGLGLVALVTPVTPATPAALYLPCRLPCSLPSFPPTPLLRHLPEHLGDFGQRLRMIHKGAPMPAALFHIQAVAPGLLRIQQRGRGDDRTLIRAQHRHRHTLFIPVRRPEAGDV